MSKASDGRFNVRRNKNCFEKYTWNQQQKKHESFLLGRERNNRDSSNKIGVKNDSIAKALINLQKT